jgi:hypothetical protein
MTRDAIAREWVWEEHGGGVGEQSERLSAAVTGWRKESSG